MMISSSLRGLFSLRTLFSACCVLLSLGLLVWSLVTYHQQSFFYGARAIYTIIFLSVVVAMVGQILLLRMIKVEIGWSSFVHSQQYRSWHLLLFFDVAAPVYLTAGVLLGLPDAVLTALLTQLCVQAYTRWHGLISWSEGWYRVVTTGLLVLLASAMYQYSLKVVQTGNPPSALIHSTESRELMATLLATVVLMIVLAVVALPVIMKKRQMRFRQACSEYVHSPVPLFQLMVLSVGTLLPVVDIFDNAVAELAWVFFLVPLLAIYYLALVSTRLRIRTEELQTTLEDLRSARQRQDELRGYASLVTRVQEEERKRLARELHDDTAQALVALSRGLDGLGRAVEALDLPQKDRDWLANLQDLADHTLDGVRRACRDLRPSILDDLGLRAALEWLCDSSSNRGVVSHFSCLGTVSCTSPEAEIAIFRIAQEALSNVWRHAQATHVDVELQYLPVTLLLRIQDDGRGFPVEQMHDERGKFGLVGMRERAMLIGAELTIETSPGCGCTVWLKLPLECG